MHITIVTFGSRGDIQPFLHLAAGLRDSGHHIRFCSHDFYRASVEGYGIEFSVVGRKDPREIARTDYEKRPSSRFGMALRLFRKSRAPITEELHELQREIGNTDLVICNQVANLAYHVSQSKGIPCMFAYLHPTHPTSAFPSPVSPQSFALGGMYNRLTHLVLRQLFWMRDRDWINDWRRRSLGLQPISWIGPSWQQSRDQVPFLFGFSQHLVPPIKDWPAWHPITGFWFDERSDSQAPDQALLRFLGGGPKPVVICFGSVSSPSMPLLMREVIAGLKKRNKRIVLVAGWSDPVRADESSDVFVVSSVSYRWLFPQVAAAVHAAGSGTAAEVVRAGIPSIAVPFAGEQKFWAHRLWQLGIAPRPIPCSAVTAESISAAMEEIERTPEMSARASTVAKKVSQEGGVIAAIRFIEKWAIEKLQVEDSRTKVGV